MNCTGPVFKKNVLSFCSGIYAMNEGNGPGGSAENFGIYASTMDASMAGSTAPSTTILMSTDPITAEMQAIKMMRLNKKPAASYALNDLPPYLLASAGVTGKTNGSTYNIGIVDESKMDIRRVLNGVTLVDQVSPHRSSDVAGKIVVSSVKGRPTFFEFKLPGMSKLQSASIGIYRINGSLVYQRDLPLSGVVNHFSWDNQSSNGTSIGAGAYIIHVRSGKTLLSKQFTISA
jgi:hypothetical protein